MANNYSHASVILRAHTSDPLLHGFGVCLLETLDTKELTTFPGHAGETVDRIPIAKNLESLAEQHKRFALGVIYPTLSRTTHVYHEHGSDVSVELAFLGKQSFWHFHAMAQVGMAFDNSIDVDVAAIFLLLDSIAGAWSNPLSGRINPNDLTVAYARAARQRGAHIIENCSVSELIFNDDRVAAIETSTGRMAVDAVVVSAGVVA